MAGLTHAGVVITADDPAYEVGSDEWNANHLFTGGAQHQLLFQGAASVISTSADLTWNDTTKVLTPAGTLAMAANAITFTDSTLLRNAANVLEIRNGTNPQGLLIDNTWTNASNYERGFARWTSNVFAIGTEGLGTGAVTPRSLTLTAGAWVAVLNGANGSFTVPAKIAIANAGGVSSGLTTSSSTAGSYATTDWVNNAGAAAQMLMAGSTFSNGIFTPSSASFYTTGTGGLLLGASDTTGIIRFFTGGFTTGDERFRFGASGQMLSVPKALSGTPATTGSYFNIATATFTDNATAGSGTAASFAAHAFQAPTLAATNASVTTTNAATVYISGAPIAGTNETLTNAWALNVASGKVNIGGGITIGAGTAVTKVLSATATLDFPSTLPATGSDLTITVTGAAVGDNVVLGVPNDSIPSANCAYFGWVSAADTVTVRFINAGSLATDPASGTFRATVVQH